MNTINNLLSNLNLDLNFTNNHESEKNDEIKNDEIKNDEIICENDIQLPSLSQGYKFKEYKNQIYENTEKKININMDGSITKITNTQKEGFQGLNPNTLKSVREEYNKTLNEYNNLLQTISKTVSSNIDRTSEKNTYLNKFIRFTDSGAIYYVTKKGFAKYVPSPSILNSIGSKNGCPVLSYVNVTIPWSYKYKIPGETIPTNPPLIVGTEMQEGESCGYEGSNVYVSSMLNNPNPVYKGCYQDSASTPSMTFIGSTPSTSANSSSTKSGTYSFEQCQQNAVDRGYKYFALQNTNESNGLGYCAVSNDLTNSTKFGSSYKFIPLWSSNTAGKPVSYAILKNNGTLNVCDSNGNVFYTTPNNSVNCTQINYSSSVNVDAPGNDLGFFSGQTVDSCKRLCNDRPQCNGFAWNKSDNRSCWLKTGKLNNVRKNRARIMYNKVVNTNNCVFFLVLQGDGNMCIYKGIPNTPNNRYVWCSFTNGKQKISNANYSVAKSKYGQPFITTNQILNKGDWVVSADGKLLLTMQTDGNLVLYTFQSNCGTIANKGNKYFGGVDANPIYDIGTVGNQTVMGSIGFVDPNSELHTYSSTNIKYGNTYSSILENTNIKGNDIEGASFADCFDIKQCMTACNKLDNCSGFVFDTTGPTPVCIPKKNTSFYDSNLMEAKMKNNTYIRDKKVINPPFGINDVVNNIDSIRFDNYVKYTPNNLNFNLNAINSVQKKQLQQLETRLKQLSDQMSGNTNNLLNIHNNIQLNTEKNTNLFNKNIKDVYSTNHQIKNFDLNNNLDNMLKATEIKTLQENYSYMFWSIIAITSVLVVINIKK
jgi:hypothetical protein